MIGYPDNKFSRLKVLLLCGSLIACLQLVWIGLKNIKYGYGGTTLLISSTDADFWSSWHTAAANSSSINVDEIQLSSCARDVFFPLHKVSDNNEHDDNCRGMLIRDDIIITSRECSKYNFTFTFPGLGILEAMPHIYLSHQISNSRLGFLETTAPHHYYSIYQPVRRIRMFLGRKSNKDTIIECGEEDRPIAHNFPITNRDLIPLHELEGILQKDILWDDDILHTKMSIEQTNNSTYRWWQPKISIEEEEQAFEQLLKQYKGPKGSIYLPDVANLCEVIDPRGHRSYCFRKYRKEWKNEEPFSGQHFFEWLDYGAGRQLLQHKRGRNKDRCNKMSCELPCFDKRTHQYLDDEEVVKHEMYITQSQDGQDLIARYKHNNELVPESGDDNDNAYTYMWNLNRSFYISPGEVQHMTLLSGQAALSGGKLYIGKNGRLWGINYSSGHYKPEIRAAAMMYKHFKDKGYNTSALYWIGRAGRHPWLTKDSLEPTTPCLGKILKIDMLTDAYPNEISWDLIRTCSQDIVLSSTFFGSIYTDDFTQYSNEYCIEDTKYTFIIKDAYGDGICCLEGNGSYQVFYDGELVAERGEFSTIEESQEFGIESCNPTPPTAPFPTPTPISKPTSFNPQDLETVITCGSTLTDSTVDEEDGKWYRLADVTGRVTLNTCGSDFDTMLDVYRELGTDYVGGNDDSCGLQSVVEIEAEEGVDYKVHVHGYESSEGTYVLSVVCDDSTTSPTTTKSPTLKPTVSPTQCLGKKTLSLHLDSNELNEVALDLVNKCKGVTVFSDTVTNDGYDSYDYCIDEEAQYILTIKESSSNQGYRVYDMTYDGEVVTSFYNSGWAPAFIDTSVTFGECQEDSLF